MLGSGQSCTLRGAWGGGGPINKEKIKLRNPFKMDGKKWAMISTTEIIAPGRRLRLKNSGGCQNY